MVFWRLQGNLIGFQMISRSFKCASGLQGASGRGVVLLPIFEICFRGIYALSEAFKRFKRRFKRLQGAPRLL